MTASIQAPRLAARVRAGRRPMLGFGPIFRKEISEWVRSRRFVIVAFVATVLGTLGALSAWLERTVGNVQLSVGGDGPAAAHAASLDPTVTTIALFQVPIVSVLAILATASLLAGERQSGTLAWAVSMPISRVAILIAKWSAATIAFGVAAIGLPIAASAVASSLAYGGSPDLTVVVPAAVLYAAVPAFYVAFTLTVGTLTTSQATVAGLGLLLVLAPALLGSLVPAVLIQALPIGIGEWAVSVAAGSDAPLTTPIGWAVSMAVLAGIAVTSLRRLEL
jgi:ABC-type transport system involved in multi-copper enzyme maturation permease subunit